MRNKYSQYKPHVLAHSQFSGFSRSVLSNSLRPHRLQHAKPPCPSPTPEVCPNSCLLSQWCHPTISSSVVPFSSSCLQSFPASGSYWVSCSHQGAKVLEFQLQPQSFQWIFRIDFLKDWLVWSPCSPRDSQESSPTSQFKNINSLVLSFLYSPTLTSICDYWKNHSFDLEGPLSAVHQVGFFFFISSAVPGLSCSVWDLHCVM